MKISSDSLSTTRSILGSRIKNDTILKKNHKTEQKEFVKNLTSIPNGFCEQNYFGSSEYVET